MASIKEVASAAMAEVSAQLKAEDAAAEEREEDLLPAYYRQDIFFLITKVADKLAPERTHHMVQISPNNQAQKRMKGWRPVDDAAFIAQLSGALGGVPSASANGHFTFNGQELWAMPRKVANAIRNRNSRRAHNDASAPRQAVKAQLSDIEGRSHGAVTPFVSDDPLRSK